jgi:photosystem II stability/assembly factor-like uncharacterized protein
MTWLPVFLTDGTELAFAQSKSSPNVMYLGASQGQRGSVFKSTDGGTSWLPVGAEDLKRSVHSLQVDAHNPDVVYVKTNLPLVGTICVGCALMKSLNGGRTWRSIAENTERFVSLDPRNGSHLVAGNGMRGNNASNFFESGDGGATWQYNRSLAVSASQKGTKERMSAVTWAWFMFHPNEDGVRAAVVGRDGWSSYHLIQSRDGGSSWNDISIPETSQVGTLADIRALAWSLKSPRTIYAGSPTSLYATTDDGQGWSRILPYPTSGILAPASGDVYALTTAGILKSRNEGRSWHLASLGLPTAPGSADCSLLTGDEDDIYVGCQTGFWKTPDGGLSWSWSAITANPSEMPGGRLRPKSRRPEANAEILPSNRGPGVRNLLVAKDKTIYANLVSQNDAQIVKIQPDGKTVNVNLRDRTPIVIGFSPADSQVLYATTREGLMKSDDAGFTWQTFDLSQRLRPNAAGAVMTEVLAFAVAPSSSKIVYALLARRNPNALRPTFALGRTLDGGATWSDVFPALMPNAGDSRTGYAIAIDPKDPRTVYLAFNGGAFRSVDAGARWSRMPIRAGTVNDIAVSSESPQVLFAAADTGAWISRNAGATWSLSAAGLQQDKLTRIISAGHVTLSQGQWGIYRLTNGDMTWAAAKWREMEQSPDSNPISFAPVVVTSSISSSRGASAANVSAPNAPKAGENPYTNVENKDSSLEPRGVPGTGRTVKDYLLTLGTCRLEADRVTCELTVTNKGGARNFRVLGHDCLIRDAKGNEHHAVRATFGTKKCVTGDFGLSRYGNCVVNEHVPAEVPFALTLEFAGVPSADEVLSMHVALSDYTPTYFSADFYRIPLEK